MTARNTRAGPNPGRVLNFTTTIDPSKSVNEIQSILVAHGARRFSTLFVENGQLDGISFTLDISGVERGFEMRADWRRVRKRLIDEHNKRKSKYTRGYWKDAPGDYGHNVPDTVDDQAKRTAWRIMKDAIEVMVNLADTGIADIGQVFFGFGVLDTGATIYEAFVENQKSLPSA